MRLSIQCYTLREDFQKDVWKTFVALKEMGFFFVELAGYYGLSPKELKQGLDGVGLQVSGSHLGLEDLENDLERVIEDNYTLDNRYLILPWIGKEAYADGWDRLGVRLDRIGERVREAGLWFAYHNHAFELEPVGDSTGLLELFRNSSPENVLAQIDIAWVAHGGADPADYIRQLGERARLVHLKDITPDGKDVEAGDGVVDWEAVLAACDDAEVEFGTLELDVPPQGIHSVRRSLDFYRSRGLSF